MTIRTDKKLLVAVWAATISAFTLAGSLTYAAVRVGVVYGMISSEHQQILRENQDIINILRRSREGEK